MMCVDSEKQMLIVVLFCLFVSVPVLGFRDEKTPPAGSCDANEIAYKGTDNRWLRQPEVPFYASFESDDLIPNWIGGSIGPIHRPLLTHCPDARSIRCDPETNLFHANNYLSIPLDSVNYGIYMAGLFNYTVPLASISCSDYAKVISYDPKNPTIPPSGYSNADEPLSYSKLVFHSIQMIGDVSSEEDNCTNFWKNNNSIWKNNPPFFCVYTPSVYHVSVQDSKTCSALMTQSNNFPIHQQGQGPQFQANSYITNPNCGASILANNTEHIPIDTNINSKVHFVDKINGFFQIWLAPIDWSKYNWGLFMNRDSDLSEVGYDGLISKMTERFVDCDRQAVDKRDDRFANLCLPYMKREHRNPLLVGPEAKKACNVMRQIECAPPPHASLTNEGLECFCSFPYTNNNPELLDRDPWDTYCFSGTLSSPIVHNQNPTTGNGVSDVLGNDFVIYTDIVVDVENLKEETNNQWTFNDWTPIFTSPPFRFTCPPPGYLVVENLKKNNGRDNWVIRSIVTQDHYKILETDIAPFLDPIGAWVSSKWPKGIPLPTSPVYKPADFDVGIVNQIYNESKVNEYFQFVKFKDYNFAASFLNVSLVTAYRKELASKSHTERQFISSEATNSPDVCTSSESNRHYGAKQRNFNYFYRAENITCSYDIELSYIQKKSGLTSNGRIVLEIPRSFRSILELKYSPNFADSYFKQNVYYPLGGSNSYWKENEKVFYNDSKYPEKEVFYEHTCYSRSSNVADCVIETTQNLRGEASFVLQNLNRRKDHSIIGHLNSTVFFVDGICTTPMLNATLPNSCRRPGNDYLDKWYLNALGIHNKSLTWKRELNILDNSIMTQPNPTPVYMTHNEFTERLGTCPPEQLITCDTDKGWFVLADENNRWSYAGNLLVNSTNSFNLCPEPLDRYVVYFGTKLFDLSLLKVEKVNTAIPELEYVTEGANIECLYIVMYHSNRSSVDPNFVRRNYFNISFASSGYVISPNGIAKNTLLDGVMITVPEYEARKSGLVDLIANEIDMCLSNSYAKFRNYSDPTIRRCSCLDPGHRGTGCVCGGSTFMIDSPVSTSQVTSRYQSGRFSYVTNNIIPDKWNTNQEYSCKDSPILKTRKTSPSTRLYLNYSASMDPFSVRFICPTPASLVCNEMGFYESESNGINERGALFSYVPGSLRANYRLDPDSVSNMTSPIPHWAVSEVDKSIIPHTCWLTKSKMYLTNPTKGIANKNQYDLLKYTSDMPPQLEITFATGSDKKRISELKCNYILSAPHCPILLSDEGLWKSPPTVKFSLKINNPSLVWLDQYHTTPVMKFNEKCHISNPSESNSTYICPGVSGWCGDDIGLRTITDPIYKSGEYESVRTQYRYCCMTGEYVEDECLSGNGGGYVPWITGNDVSRGEYLHKIPASFYAKLVSTNSQFLACQLKFSKAIAGIVPNEPIDDTEIDNPSPEIPYSPFEFAIRSAKEKRDILNTPVVNEDINLFQSISSGSKKKKFEFLSENGKEMSVMYMSDTIDYMKEHINPNSGRSTAALPRVTGCPDPRRDFTCESGVLKSSSYMYTLQDPSIDPCLYVKECLGETVLKGVVDPFRSSEVQWGLTNVTIHFVTEAILMGGSIPPTTPANITATANTVYDWMVTYGQNMSVYSNYSIVCEYGYYRNPLIRHVFAGVPYDFPICPIKKFKILGPKLIPDSSSTFVEYHKRVNSFTEDSPSKLDFFESPFVPVRLLSLFEQRLLFNLSKYDPFNLDVDPYNTTLHPEVFIPLPGWDRRENLFLSKHVLTEMSSSELIHPNPYVVLMSFPIFRGECVTAFGRYLEFREENSSNNTNQTIALPTPCSSFSHSTFVCDCPFYDIRATSPVFSNVATSCSSELSQDTIRTTGTTDPASRYTITSYSEPRKKRRKQDILPRERTTCPSSYEIYFNITQTGDIFDTIFLGPPGFSSCLVYSPDTPPSLSSELIFKVNCSSSDTNTSAISIRDGTHGNAYSRVHFIQASIDSGSSLYCSYAFQNVAKRNGGSNKEWYIVRYKSDHPYAVLPIHMHTSLVFPVPSSKPYAGGWTSGAMCSPDFSIRNPEYNDEIRDYTNQWFRCMAVCGDVGIGDYKRKENRFERKEIPEEKNTWPRWQWMVDVCSCPVARMDSSVVLDRDDYIICDSKYAPSIIDGVINTTTSVRYGDFWFRSNTPTTTATDLDPAVEHQTETEFVQRIFPKNNKRPLMHTCPPSDYIDSKILPTLPYLTSNIFNGPAKQRTSYANSFLGGLRETIFADDRHNAFILEEVFPVESIQNTTTGRNNYVYWNHEAYITESDLEIAAFINQFSRENMTRFYEMFMCGNRTIDDIYVPDMSHFGETSTLCQKTSKFVGAQISITTGISSLNTIYSTFAGNTKRKENIANIRDVSIPSGGTLFCSYVYPLTVSAAGQEAEHQSILADPNKAFRYPREAILVLRSMVGDHYVPPINIWRVSGYSSIKPTNRYLVYSYSAAKLGGQVKNKVYSEDFWILVSKNRRIDLRKGGSSDISKYLGTSYWYADCGINSNSNVDIIDDVTYNSFVMNNPCACQVHLTNGDSRLQYEWDYRTESSCVISNFDSSVPKFTDIDYAKCKPESIKHLVDRFEFGLTRRDGGIANNIDYPALIFRVIDLGNGTVIDPFPETTTDVINITGIYNDSLPTLEVEDEILDILYYNDTVMNVHGKKFFGSALSEWTQNMLQGAMSENKFDASSTCPPPECLSALLSKRYVDTIEDFGYQCLERDRESFFKNLIDKDPLSDLPDVFKLLVSRKTEADEKNGFFFGKACIKRNRDKILIEDILLPKPKTIKYKGDAIYFRGVRILVPNKFQETDNIKDYTAYQTEFQTSGEREPVISCEYYDSLKDNIIQLQSFITVPRYDGAHQIFGRHTIGSYVPLLYPRQLFWKLGNYTKIFPEFDLEEKHHTFQCSSKNPSKSVCHCSLVKLSGHILPWDGCTKCGASNDIYGSLDPYATSGSIDKFSLSSCSIATQTIETTSMSFVGLCGFITQNRTSVVSLEDKKFRIKNTNQHLFDANGDNILIKDPLHPGDYIRDPSRTDESNIIKEPVLSDSFISMFNKDTKLVSLPYDYIPINPEDRKGICPNITDTKLFGYLIPDSILMKYFLILSNDVNTKVSANSILKRDVWNSFTKVYCPKVGDIRFHPRNGFVVDSTSGSSDWYFSKLEHTVPVTNGPHNVSVNSYTRKSSSPLFGMFDVDQNSIRFIASYETPIHQCKYSFYTISTYPIPYSESVIPYNSFPQFFYMTPRIKDISNLVKHSCRTYLKNERNTFTLDPYVYHSDIGENYDNDCYIYLPLDKVPTLSGFISNVSFLLLCNNTDTVSSLPMNFYQIYTYFVGLGNGTGYPTSEVISSNFEVFINIASKTHPLYTNTTKIRFCQALDPIDCPLLLPPVPFSDTKFISYSVI